MKKNEWINEWTCRIMNGLVEEWMNEWTCRRMNDV